MTSKDDKKPKADETIKAAKTTAAEESEVAKSDPAVVDAPVDPAPVTELESPSGAIIEPEVAKAVDVTHEAVDANPRDGTTAEQNAIDWNDAKRAKPQDEDFAGQGLDQSVYGKKG